MRYKDYVARVEFDDEAGLFHGEVINTRDVITFQGTSVEELQNALKESVEDYLAFCASRGEEPEKPFSGKFVVRTSSEVHRRIFAAAAKQGVSLNTWVARTLERAAAGEGKVAEVGILHAMYIDPMYVRASSGPTAPFLEGVGELKTQSLGPSQSEVMVTSSPTRSRTVQ